MFCRNSVSLRVRYKLWASKNETKRNEMKKKKNVKKCEKCRHHHPRGILWGWGNSKSGCKICVTHTPRKCQDLRQSGGRLPNLSRPHAKCNDVSLPSHKTVWKTPVSSNALHLLFYFGTALYTTSGPEATIHLKSLPISHPTFDNKSHILFDRIQHGGENPFTQKW